VKTWIARLAPPLVVGVVPVVVLAVGVIHFILLHFFVRPPFLLDSGWYSAIVYRAGLFPLNPEIACDYAEWYFGVHFSPFVSAFSLLSYLAPLPRIEWYALFEALVFVPLGIATYALASRLDPASVLRRLPVTFLAAISFALGGQVLWLVGYPHYEAAIPGFICLTLVALVTGRRRLAWVFVLATASVREDAGFHAALALLPLVYLSWRGVEIRSSRRTIVRMIGVAVAISVFGMAMQKLVFHSANLLRTEYLGDPAYDHLTTSLVAERAGHFLEQRQVFYYPFIATALIAALRRDARYLLGWAAAAPWFVVNFTAHQDAKGLFLYYTGFPFIVSTFWVYLYGAMLAPAARRLRPGVLEAIFALVCASSTLGWYRGTPIAMRDTVRAMATAPEMNRWAVHGFVGALEAHRAELGRFYVDNAVAAVALEALQREDAWTRGAHADAIAFHRDTRHEADELLPDIIANHLDACTQILDTGLCVCSRKPLPAVFEGLAIEVVPSLFVFANRDYTGIRGPLGRLAPGTYELKLTFLPSAKPAQLVVDGSLGQHAMAPAGSTALSATFTADGHQLLSFRFGSEAPLFVTGAEARAIRP
jgi:hypothetical protein